MEFGNIGNYYIIEPFFRELRRVFEGAVIKTTLQMSDHFCLKHSVTSLPMHYYYAWSPTDVETARKEVAIAEHYRRTGELLDCTPYIEALFWADLVIDFSGDIWGDNADLLGFARFEIGLLKDRAAQILGKKTVMLAGSPGPFNNSDLKTLAKDVYERFDLVTNREPLSTKLLEREGFDCSNTLTLACPAFLFEPAPTNEVEDISNIISYFPDNQRKPIVGFILCGWNFEEGPFDKWPRNDHDYLVFAEAVELLSTEFDARVCLMSHSNGFDVPPAPFMLRHGRDYPIIKQLQKVVEQRGIARDVIALDGVYSAWETKTIIGSMDMLVSGRVHAAVAAFSQHVPTVIIDYGHEPRAHKLKGFAEIAGAQDYVACPSSRGDLIDRIRDCWNKRVEYKIQLVSHMPTVRKQAKSHFDLLKSI